jgi:multimeric flavodoxin WrbA
MKGAASKGADVHTVALRKLKIGPCTHCDACLKTGRCKIKDDMQGIYDEMEAADRIVLAAPIQFMGLPSQAKAMVDRCQCLWARKYVLKVPPLGDERPRKGFFVSVGGTRLKDMFQPARSVVKTWFHILNVEYAGELLFSRVDDKGAIRDKPGALQQAYELGEKVAGE